MKKKKIIVPIVIMAFIIAVTVDILILSRGTEAKDVEMAKILLEECEESIVIDSYTITMTGTYIQEDTGFFLVSFAVTKEGGIPEVTFRDGGDGELKNNSFGENNRFYFKFYVTGGRYMKGELSGNTLYLYFRAHLHPDDDDIGELSECFRLIDSKNENEKTLSGFDEYHFDLSDKFTDKFAIFSNGVNMVYVTAAGVAVKPAGEGDITSLFLVMEDGSSRDIVGGNIGISPDAVTVKSQTAQIYYYEPEDLIEYDKVTKVIVNGVEYSRSN